MATTCGTCGSALRQRARFCHRCGLAAATPPLRRVVRLLPRVLLAAVAVPVLLLLLGVADGAVRDPVAAFGLMSLAGMAFLALVAFHIHVRGHRE